MSEPTATNDEAAWTDNFTYTGRCGHMIHVRDGRSQPHDCATEREGLAEIAGVLAEHRTACIPRIYPAWSCSCGGWDGSRDDGAQDTIEAAEAHLADALADLLVARDRRVRAEVWDEGHHCATCNCAGTECRMNEWCKRVWGHGGSCSIIRDEGFDQ